MKKILFFLISCCPALAASGTHLELADLLEHAVHTIADGGVSDGVDQIFAPVGGSHLPKDKIEDKQKFKSTLDDARRMGKPRRVTRVSMVSFGDGFYRLRILDRRAGGAILWTFVCERDEDRWVMTSVRLNADEQMGALVNELDAADFSKDEPKQP